MGVTPQPSKRKEPSSGKKERSSSGKKKNKPDSRQRTLANAFGKAKDRVELPPLEQSKRSSEIRSFDHSNIVITHEYYERECIKKYQYVPDMDETSMPGRPVRRVRYNFDDDDQPLDKIAKLEQERAFGDEYGYRFISLLNEVTNRDTMPSKQHLQMVASLLRSHGIHGRRDLSNQAYSFLKRVESLHPATSIQFYEGNKEAPFVAVNPTCWTLTGCCEEFKLDPFPKKDSDRRLTPFQIFDHLITLMHNTTFPPELQGKVSARSTALITGELLLLKYIIGQFEKDLACRLEVFNSEGAQKQKDRRIALLQNSQLWRTFSDSALSGQAIDQKAIVKKLVEIIAPSEIGDDIQYVDSLESVQFNRACLSEMASRILRMLLELYGTAEDFKMFFRHGSSRATNTGAMENVRMIIEDAMQESFAMFNNDFKTITQRQAFLQVLHPKDRLRLLTMVVATKHAKRKGDQEKYPGLEDFNRFKNEPGSVQSYLHAKPIEALKYVEEDTNLAYNLIDKTADGLALLVSSITQASITELSDSDLKVLGQKLGKIVSSLLEKSLEGKSSKVLSPSAVVSLKQAQLAVKAY